ncbi:DeoR family transcriptional regulator [Kaistia sp. 32K]|nr:DeoR family transcriptional regulator [Kaistia sp. 32K]
MSKLPAAHPKSPAHAVSIQARPRLPEMRQAAILDALRASGAVLVAEIAAELQVSDMTVRRDLLELERAGKLVRTHGGAMPAAAAPPVAMDSEEPGFDARLRHQRDAKERIAAAAATLSLAHRAIALDVGTTTFLLAQHLRERTHAKVFTNSVRAAELLGASQTETYLAGGRVRRDELSVGGAEAVAQFEKLWFDVCFVGISGLTKDGLFDYSIEDVDLKQVYLNRSGLKVALCDASKFQRMSLVHVAPLADLDVLITDAAPPPEIAAALAAARVDVQVAP